MKNRTLYFGDNLEILRKRIPDESFDLIYLDPPFNSNRNYNVLFKEGIQDSPAQVHAFEDSWHWAEDSKHTFDYLVMKSKKSEVADLMLALEKMIGHNDMLAYLTMMTVRLIELHRVLKQTGSIYLHCDPTASHYLKIVMDVIFGKVNFRNEIIWKRATMSGAKSVANQYGKNHDTILFYSRSKEWNYFTNYIPYSSDYISKKFIYKEQDGRIYRLQPRGTRSDKAIEEFKKQGRIVESKTGYIQIKFYLDDMEGVALDDIWVDIKDIRTTQKEKLGYPTQKPEALLERIIKASSKKGDWILDPFCGCGTTIAAAEKLKRNWIGIDITMLSINLVKHRLEKQFNLGLKQINVDGQPADLSGAKALFSKDPFEFEYWALDLINAMPANSKTKENMRGADKGIDGIITFHKENENGNWKFGKIIVQVKGGGVQRNQIATLKGDVEREKADGGLFITLEKPTKPMISEAVDAGSFVVPFTKAEFPKIQILTVEELLNGKKPNIPMGFAKNYYKEAKVAKIEETEQSKLF